MLCLERDCFPCHYHCCRFQYIFVMSKTVIRSLGQNVYSCARERQKQQGVENGAGFVRENAVSTTNPYVTPSNQHACDLWRQAKGKAGRKTNTTAWCDMYTPDVGESGAGSSNAQKLGHE